MCFIPDSIVFSQLLTLVGQPLRLIEHGFATAGQAVEAEQQGPVAIVLQPAP